MRIGRERLKREARVAYIEAISKDHLFLVAIVFRGCWIDGIMIIEDHKSAEEVEAWLAGSNYFEELTGIALGPEIIDLLGKGGKIKVEAWSESKGKKIISIGSRNRDQARVIINGVKQIL